MPASRSPNEPVVVSPGSRHDPRPDAAHPCPAEQPQLMVDQRVAGRREQGGEWRLTGARRLVEDDEERSGHAPPSSHQRRLHERQRVRAYLGLGANLGDAPQTLARAVRGAGCPAGSRLVGVSRLYATRPVGVLDQPDFHNAVVGLDVLLAGRCGGPRADAADRAQGARAAFGRQQRARWGPRELDLDLLVFGRHRFRRERSEQGRSLDPARTGVQWLDVPHPAVAERTVRAGAARRPRARPGAARLVGRGRDRAARRTCGGGSRCGPGGRTLGLGPPAAGSLCSAAPGR